MATGGSGTDSNDTLICPVCLDTFQDPRVLPCGHSLCGPRSDEKCIIKLEKRDGTITCPTCRKTHSMKATDATVSFTLANLVAEMKLKRMCEKHAQEILCYCETDDQEICMTCWQVDHMGGNHKVFPISTKAERKLLKQWRERDSKRMDANSGKEIRLIVNLESTLKQLKDRQMSYHDSLAELMDEDRDSRGPDSTKLKDFLDLELKKTKDDLNDWQFLAGQVGPRTTPNISIFHGSGPRKDQIHVSSTYHKVRSSVPKWKTIKINSSMKIWDSAEPIFSPDEKSFYVQTTSSSFERYTYDLEDHSFHFQEVYQLPKRIYCIALGPESSIYISFESEEADVCQYFRQTGQITNIDVSKVPGGLERWIRLISFRCRNVLLLEKTDRKWCLFKNNKFIKIVTLKQGFFVNQENEHDYGLFAEMDNGYNGTLKRFSFNELEQPVENSDEECTTSMHSIDSINGIGFCCLDLSVLTAEKCRLIMLTNATQSNSRNSREQSFLEFSVFETNKFFLDAVCIGKSKKVFFDTSCPDTFQPLQFVSINGRSAQLLGIGSYYSQSQFSRKIQIAELF